jgi:hypothetical protein
VKLSLPRLSSNIIDVILCPGYFLISCLFFFLCSTYNKDAVIPGWKANEGGGGGVLLARHMRLSFKTSYEAQRKLQGRDGRKLASRGGGQSHFSFYNRRLRGAKTVDGGIEGKGKDGRKKGEGKNKQGRVCYTVFFRFLCNVIEEGEKGGEGAGCLEERVRCVRMDEHRTVHA